VRHRSCRLRDDITEIPRNTVEYIALITLEKKTALQNLTVLFTSFLLSTQTMAFSSPPYEPVDWFTSETLVE
jgi:hypothetical protein